MDGNANRVGAPNLRSDHSKSRSVNDVLLQRVLDLGRVDAALERLVDGTFGLCLACDEQIDLEHLLTDPSQKFCGRCLSKPHQLK